MNLHYLCFYTGDTEGSEYHGTVAADIKVGYVAETAKEAGYAVRILALNKTRQKGRQKAKITEQNGIRVRHIASNGGGNFFAKTFNRLSFYCQIIRYFFREVKRGDTVLLYHSMRTTPFLAFLKKFRNIPVILEVEEIYACSADGVQPYYKNEIRAIKKYRDYIFVNDYIPKELGIPEDHWIALYGVYRPVEGKKTEHEGKRVLYAGAIERLNQGAFRAVEAARYLPSDYEMRIIGKGEPQDMEALSQRIQQVNELCGREVVRYDGFRSGGELDRYMLDCDIGLGAYPIQTSYSNYIFPSKLVSYMCRRLKVVTGRAECYENTPFASQWFFYDANDGESIAKAILEAGKDTGEPTENDTILELHRAFLARLISYRQNRNWFHG